MDNVTIQVIARMHSDFATKFGIPRQSGLVEELRSTIVFEPEFRNPDALRGIEDFSHLWIIWQFSEAVQQGWSPTVRPPRLGGNTRMGVFATRSPFRPNNLGLSSVRLLGVEHTEEFGTVLHVGGADLMDGTPIFDIKPYIPYADVQSDATEGFTEQDSKVAGYAHEQGKACVVAVNKWDLVEKDGTTMDSYRKRLMKDFSFMEFAPIIFISAKTGQRIDRLFELIKYVREQNTMRISTGKLNDILAEATARVQPPTDKGRRLKIYYVLIRKIFCHTQTSLF